MSIGLFELQIGNLDSSKTRFEEKLVRVEIKCTRDSLDNISKMSFFNLEVLFFQTVRHIIKEYKGKYLSKGQKMA